MNNANYMYVISNSHFWTDLNQILVSYESANTPLAENQISFIRPEDTVLNKEYLIIGLENSIKNGYKIIPINKFNLVMSPVFISIEDMIKYVKSESFNEDEFCSIITNSINTGFNLTNGLKIDRQDVYKAIDGERDYQDRKWGKRNVADGIPDEEKPVSEWLNYIEFHLEKAKKENYFLKKDYALAELRKVAALAVRALEIHGCPLRDTLIIN